MPLPLLRTAAAFAMLLGFATAVAAQARWPDERQAGPFQCHADFSLQPHQALLEELSVLQEDLAHTLGAGKPREPVHLFLFQTKSTYQGYLTQYFPRVPYRRALYIKARGPGMVFAYQGSDFEIDVRHESTHALLHAWLPSVPLWLDEGLAEYFEMARDKRAAENPHHAVLRVMIRSGELPRLEELEQLDNLEGMGRDEYRDAWAWVHFLLHGPPEARDQLLRYLVELEAGDDPGPISNRLRSRIPQLNRRLAEHFQ
jgi:hypothetical protein